MANREALARSAFAKRHPEWEDELKGANIGIAWAHKMASEGKLTHKECKEYEAHLWSEMLEEMPMEVFSEMQEDGSLHDLEALARGYDDDRDSHDVTEGRKAIERKVFADALEQRWLQGAIDNKTYAQMSREHVGKSERLDDLIADGDHDEAAFEAFGEKYDVKPAHDNKLANWLNETYGGTKNPDGSKWKPYEPKRDDRSNQEKATDKAGILDLDMLADLECGRSDYSSVGPPGYVEHETVHDLGSILSDNSSNEDDG
ncbi:hypothetical protein [Bradyrhizobium sp. McL0616]|uniref:hypothetical protein n=1 Tax=Bradyrhizobium sp. McL0616 TaxID=3415674 RepID=UPI003CF6C198